MNQKYYYIYIITNTLTKRSYVGSRSYERSEPYWGSSKYLTKDIEEYGMWNFSKQIIEIFPFTDRYELSKRESEYMNIFNTFEPNGYNRHNPSSGCIHFGGCHVSKETKQKIRLSTKGIKKMSELAKYHMSLAQLNRPKESTKHIGDSRRGKTYEEIYGVNKAEELKILRSGKKIILDGRSCSLFICKCKVCNKLFASHRLKEYCSKGCAMKFHWFNYRERHITKQYSKQTIVICPYCNKKGGANGMYRYHFENCKYRH